VNQNQLGRERSLQERSKYQSRSESQAISRQGENSYFMKRYLPKFLYSVSTPSLICLALLLGSADALRAQTPRAIFNFDNSSHGCCAAWPHILAQGRDGSVYGTAL